MSFPYRPSDVVLARVASGKIYYAKIRSVSLAKKECVAEFDDGSLAPVEWTNIFDVAAETDIIVCVVCKQGHSDTPNEIILCDTCNIGYHQQCHPHRQISCLEITQDKWYCYYCTSSKCNPHITNPFEDARIRGKRKRKETNLPTKQKKKPKKRLKTTINHTRIAEPPKYVAKKCLVSLIKKTMHQNNSIISTPCPNADQIGATHAACHQQTIESTVYSKPVQAVQPLHLSTSAYLAQPPPYLEQPQPFHSQPQPFHSQPQPFHSQPQPFHSQPQPFHSQPQPFHSQPPPLQMSPQLQPNKFGNRFSMPLTPPPPLVRTACHVTRHDMVAHCRTITAPPPLLKAGNSCVPDPLQCLAGKQYPHFPPTPQTSAPGVVQRGAELSVMVGRTSPPPKIEKGSSLQLTSPRRNIFDIVNVAQPTEEQLSTGSPCPTQPQPHTELVAQSAAQDQAFASPNYSGNQITDLHKRLFHILQQTMSPGNHVVDQDTMKHLLAFRNERIMRMSAEQAPVGASSSTLQDTFRSSVLELPPNQSPTTSSPGSTVPGGDLTMDRDIGADVAATIQLDVSIYLNNGVKQPKEDKSKNFVPMADKAEISACDASAVSTTVKAAPTNIIDCPVPASSLTSAPTHPPTPTLPPTHPPPPHSLAPTPTLPHPPPPRSPASTVSPAPAPTLNSTPEQNQLTIPNNPSTRLPPDMTSSALSHTTSLCDHLVPATSDGPNFTATSGPKINDLSADTTTSVPKISNISADTASLVKTIQVVPVKRGLATLSEDSPASLNQSPPNKPSSSVSMKTPTSVSVVFKIPDRTTTSESCSATKFTIFSNYSSLFDSESEDEEEPTRSSSRDQATPAQPSTRDETAKQEQPPGDPWTQDPKTEPPSGDDSKTDPPSGDGSLALPGLSCLSGILSGCATMACFSDKLVVCALTGVLYNNISCSLLAAAVIYSYLAVAQRKQQEHQKLDKMDTGSDENTEPNISLTITGQCYNCYSDAQIRCRRCSSALYCSSRCELEHSAIHRRECGRKRKF